MLKIKICGITNLEDALLCAELGVDAIGFVFAPSPRKIEPNKAREIIKRLPPFLTKVGVFVNENVNKVKEIVEFCGLDVLQFHGDETPQYCEVFTQKVIKAFRIKGAEDLNSIKKYNVSAFLFDSAVKGQPFNWSLLRNFHCETPVILAGGLNPENLELALSVFHPYGVDVSSGVEAFPGKKDEKKLRKFIEVIRKWKEKVISENSGDVLSPKP